MIETNESIIDLKNKELLYFKTIGSVIDSGRLNGDNVYLRLHNDICHNCYINNIIEVSGIISESNLRFFILGSYDSNVAYNSILDDCKLQNYDNKNNSLLANKIEADKNQSPYLFTVNKIGEIDSVFFLDKYTSDSLRVDNYLKMILRHKRELN